MSDAHHYNTRFSQADTFVIQNSRTQQKIKSFPCSDAKAWNCIPLNIRSLSKHKFKAAIHRQLLDIQFFEDDYADTLTIMYRSNRSFNIPPPGMLTRLLLPLDLNSFEVCDISHFV